MINQHGVHNGPDLKIAIDLCHGINKEELVDLFTDPYHDVRK